jgi:DNA-binding winged helix-turn-helix (wHTH) protein
MSDGADARADNVLSFGPFRLFVAERLLKRADESVHVGGRALDILITLAQRAGEVVTRAELMSRVWPGITVEEATLRVHITGLRKALGEGHEAARYVANVPGRGYCFVAPITRSSSARALHPSQAPPNDHLRNLPLRLTSMIGRDEVVRALSMQLRMCDQQLRS